MKYYLCLSLNIIIALISNSSQQKLTPKSYKSTPKKINTGTWSDLLDYKVECPDNGVFKNFVLKKNDTYFWYEYKCYPYSNAGGEPIIKEPTLNLYDDNGSKQITSSIKCLNSYEMVCWVDYGLKSFKLYSKNGILNKELYCNGIKPSYVSTVTVKTNTKTENHESLAALVDILVGKEDTETDTDIGFPLRGFKYVIDTSSSSTKPTIYILYSYSKLRNMKSVLDSYTNRFVEIKKKNDLNK